jgi:hypothetical protein
MIGRRAALTAPRAEHARMDEASAREQLYPLPRRVQATPSLPPLTQAAPQALRGNQGAAGTLVRDG